MKKILKKHYDLIIISILSFYILFFYGEFKPLLFNDSQGYIDMDIIRSPLYPLWLSMFRHIMGDNYLQTVIIAQSILALVSIVVFQYVLKRVFQYKSWLSLVLWPFVIYPYISGLLDHAMYNRAILTEGLSFPLFTIYMAFFVKALIDKSNYSLFLSFVLSGIMMVLRGQMRITLLFSILLAIYMILSSIKNKKIVIKTCTVLIAGVIFAVVFSKVFNYVYTTIKFGESFEPEFGNTSMMINFLYDANVADVSKFENDEDAEFIKQEFRKTFESGYIYENRGNTMEEHNNHLMDANLYLKLHMFIPDAVSYYGAKGLNEVQIYKKYEEIAGRMLSELLPKHIPHWLDGFFSLFFYGTANAVFIRLEAHSVLCYIIAYSLMLAAVILSIICLVKKKAVNEALFMLTICIMVVGNLAACCVAIGAVGRYLAYTWGLFYVAGIMMLYRMLEKTYKFKNDKF